MGNLRKNFNTISKHPSLLNIDTALLLHSLYWRGKTSFTVYILTLRNQPQTTRKKIIMLYKINNRSQNPHIYKEMAILSHSTRQHQSGLHLHHSGIFQLISLEKLRAGRASEIISSNFPFYKLKKTQDPQERQYIWNHACWCAGTWPRASIPCANCCFSTIT